MLPTDIVKGQIFLSPEKFVWNVSSEPRIIGIRKCPSGSNS
jgi:hypothetical protein